MNYTYITTLLTARRMTLNPRVQLAIIDTRTSSTGKKNIVHTGKLRRLLDQSGTSYCNRPSSVMCNNSNYFNVSEMDIAYFLLYRYRVIISSKMSSPLFDLQLAFKRLMAD